VVDTLILEDGSSDGAFDFFVDGVFQETICWDSGSGARVLHSLNGVAGSTFRLEGAHRGFHIMNLTVAQVVIPESSAALRFGVGALLVSRSVRQRT
jgi:hypothetical protein